MENSCKDLSPMIVLGDITFYSVFTDVEWIERATNVTLGNFSPYATRIKYKPEEVE